MENYPKLIDNQTGEKEVFHTTLGHFAEQAKSEIMELLRTNGANDKESLIAVHGWLDIQEKRIEEDPTFRKSVMLEIARADFYLALNDLEEALNCLDQASMQAQQEGHFDLQDIAEEKISKIMSQ